MTIDDTYNWVSVILNSKQSGKISPADFNLACSVVNIEYFNQESGLEEEYQVGVPHAKVEPQITAKVTDNNRNLVVPVEIAKVGNYFPYPSDYGAFLSYRYGNITNPSGCGNATMDKEWTEVVTESELALRLSSFIKYPTLQFPIAGYYQNGVKVYPETVQSIHLTYLRLPVAPYRNYTVPAGSSQNVYNPVGSTDWDWPQTVIPNLCYRICKYFGINIRESEFYSMMQQRIAAGK